LNKSAGRKKVWLIERDQQGDWSKAQEVTLLDETPSSWKIRAWWCPLGWRFHKATIGYKVEEL